jgi:hypothetical protein
MSEMPFHVLKVSKITPMNICTKTMEPTNMKAKK